MKTKCDCQKSFDETNGLKPKHTNEVRPTPTPEIMTMPGTGHVFVAFFVKDKTEANALSERIVRAVNCHEELLRKLNDARKIIAELTRESKEHKKPSGRYCDECSPSQVWPCSIVRGYYEGKALEEVIAKAEGSSMPSEEK